MKYENSQSNEPVKSTISRREFLKYSALITGASFFIPNLFSMPPSRILRHASFGASGMAGADLSAITASKFVKLVAVAEVDMNRVGDLPNRFPGVKIYQDWREMLDKESNNIDSVNVSTPDHMHAPMAMSAIQLGKHVYCQKPLAHDIYEVRRLEEAAREAGVVTQMGIQIHSTREYRLAVQLIQDGAIGRIKEVHSWSNKKWGDLDPKPNRSDPIPSGFNWDYWLGVAQWRPYIGDGYYHPSNWRKRIDFGTGTFGDMGCHIFDPVFKALALTAPLTVKSEGPAPNKDNWSINAIIHYVFPGTQYTTEKTIQITWYDGDQRPPKHIIDLLEGDNLPDQGSIFIGTKGVMLLPHIASPQLYPENQFKDYPMPKVTTADHWAQFAEACVNNGITWASFDYAAPLTESVLLGSVAVRFPKTILKWDAAKLKFSEPSAANQYIRRSYRKGWDVKGL